MKTMFHPENSTIYDEGVVLPAAYTTAARPQPMPAKDLVGFTNPRTREWTAALCSRENLTKTLNTLENAGSQIFTILPVSAAQVQIIYYDLIS